MTEHDPESTISQIVRDYLDGMMYADAAKLRSVFDPSAQQIGHYQGALEIFSVEQFIQACMEAGGLEPGSPYFANILSIDVADDTAMVKLADDYMGTRFTDFLSLLYVDGRWQIVTKLFYAHPDAGRLGYTKRSGQEDLAL